MRANELLNAAVLPLRDIGVLFALTMFWLLVCLAAAAGMLGVWLALVIVPALFRYLISLVETIGRGRKPEPPGTEFFRWIGDWWSLSPAVLVVGIAWAGWELHLALGNAAMTVFLLFMGFIYPAMLAVLAVTHAPMQMLNPQAIYSMVRCLGPSYLVAPLYLAVIVGVSILLQPLPFMAELLLDLLLVFSLHALVGQLMAPHGVFDNIYIPDPLERSDDQVSADLAANRSDVLAHAYALISRGNRQGGFEHVFEGIQNDTQESAAWAWYFERMLDWENQQHALFFAQHYVHDLLQHGEDIPALKTILRCRMIDASFRPLPGDRQAALDAAIRLGNNELAAVLNGG